MRFSTAAPNDPDTHEDFKPTNKLESSDLSLNDVVEQDVKENPVMIYMKGVPEFPQCGFSSLAVRVLKQYNVPLASRNILEDPELKSAVKTFSHWPQTGWEHFAHQGLISRMYSHSLIKVTNMLHRVHSSIVYGERGL
ncbi:monothiol glutaredoxin-S15, mitochondrial-like [Quercus suber]|uniref:monothiol glutaredoxin-S15, mitochondrial-like n=1 Tax=Quercus suber TaxID=58331 RepID=UPI0032DEDC1A